MENKSHKKKYTKIIILISSVIIIIVTIIICCIKQIENLMIVPIILTIITLFLSLGRNIKGWIEIFKIQKGDKSTDNMNCKKQESMYSKDSEQYMKGDAGNMSQKSTASPGSKQRME